MNRAFLRALPVVLAATVAASCTGCPLTADEQALVDRWLECTDCMNGEVDSVLALAGRNEAATVSALSEALLRAQPRLDRYRQRLQAEYLRDSLGWHHPPRLSRSAWVGMYQRAFESSYRTRAALALGYLHTAAAVSALDTASRGGGVAAVGGVVSARLVARAMAGLPRP
jgi:hypothetical protein